MRAPIACFPAIAGLLLAGFAAHAAPILLNGDFSDGKTHWHGAGDAPDTGGKLVINLKSDAWTVVYQDFSADATAVKLQIKYSFSDDCTLGRSGDALLPPLTRMGLEEACGIDNSIYDVTPSSWEDWMVLMVSGGRVIHHSPVYSNRNASYSSNVQDQAGQKTFTTTISSWNRTFERVDLCLCFPPGKGSVTITSVALTPPGQ